MTVEIAETGGNSVEINHVHFSLTEYEQIKTRILRNAFKGDYSLLERTGGFVVLRDGETFKLAKPDIVPKETWSFRTWVDESDGWKVIAEGSKEEWEESFLNRE